MARLYVNAKSRWVLARAGPRLDSTESPPDGTQSTPDGTQSTPGGTQNTPDPTENTPHLTHNTPHGTENPPDGTKNIPHDTQNTLDGTISTETNKSTMSAIIAGPAWGIWNTLWENKVREIDANTNTTYKKQKVHKISLERLT